MIFVVGELAINGTVVVVVVVVDDDDDLLGLDEEKTWWERRELKSSKDDVGEKAIEWENREAREDDGERQVLIGDVLSLNFDE